MNNKQFRNSRKKLKRKTNKKTKRKTRKNKKSRLSKNKKYISGGGFFGFLKNKWMERQNNSRKDALDKNTKETAGEMFKLQEEIGKLNNKPYNSKGGKKSMKKSNKSSKTNQKKLNKDADKWMKQTDKMFNNFEKEEERKKKSKDIDHLTRYVGFWSG